MADDDEMRAYLAQQPPGSTPPPEPKKGVNPTTVVLAGIVLLVVFGIGLVVGSAVADEPTVAATSPSSTTTRKAAIDAAVEASSTTTTSTPAPPPTEPITTAPPYTPAPADFAIEVIELERQCFGSAGCNVTYRINPTYVGAVAPAPSETFTVTYDLQGGDSPESGSFTVRNGQARTSHEEHTQIPPGGALTAVPTRVLPG